ncbi:unnamed protein product, partial [Discosporangium mesarthrocarpum]
MAGMAMAAVTKELDDMKEALQEEVITLRAELDRAGEDARRMALRLKDLEAENRDITGVLSRLGRQNARQLKAQ